MLTSSYLCRSYNDDDDVNTVLLHDATDGAINIDVPEAAGSDADADDSEVDVSSDEDGSGEDDDDVNDEDSSPKRCSQTSENSQMP